MSKKRRQQQNYSNEHLFLSIIKFFQSNHYLELSSMPVHTSSVDLSSDANFLYEYIPTSNPFVGFLLSHQITNESFTDLYKKRLV